MGRKKREGMRYLYKSGAQWCEDVAKELGSIDVARRVVLFTDRYKFSVGQLQHYEWDTFFEDQCDVEIFRKEHGITDRDGTYNEEKVRSLLLSELCLSKAQTDAFLKMDIHEVCF